MKIGENFFFRSHASGAFGFESKRIVRSRRVSKKQPQPTWEVGGGRSQLIPAHEF